MKTPRNPLLAAAASLALGLLTAHAADTDSDGLDDAVETGTGVYVSPTNTGTNPAVADTDGDGVPDGLEVKEKTSPVDGSKFNSFSQGMVAYYPFSGDVRDESGKQNHGLAENIVFVPDRSSTNQNAADFSNNGVVKCPGLDKLNNYPVTYSAWFKLNSYIRTLSYSGGGIMTLLGKEGSGTVGESALCLFTWHPTGLSDRITYLTFSGDPDGLITNSVPTLNEWNNILFTYTDSKTATIYLNGNNVGKIDPNNPKFTNLPFYIGRSSVTPSPNAYRDSWQGAIDDVRVYDRALTQEEARALYSSERPRFQIIQGLYTWHQAKADAEARGGRLAVLSTQEKIDSANQFLNQQGSWPDLWIGLTDEVTEGVWKWIDGQPLQASNWNPGEPNNLNNEDHAEIYGNQYVWNDIYLQHQSYLIEYLFSSLTIQSPAHGTITGSGDYPPGTTATLTAIPNPGYAFTSWTGDASGSTNPISIVMDADKTIGATFSPDLSDADNDGLTAYDEVTIHHTDPAKADTDGDGLTDGWELGIGRYSVVSVGMTWAQARTDAATKGGTLATFATELEWNLALQSIGDTALFDVTGLWIGATDQAEEGTWTWITGEPFTFSHWAVDQPDNLNDSDFAAVAGDLGGSLGKWYDFRGTTLRDGYILELGYSTNPTNPDADNDGLSDGEEQLAGSNPFLADTDGDGLTDTQEVRLTKTHPNSADTDGDGINDAADDQDGDTLSNLDEITLHKTDPTKADTDGDSLADNVELAHPASYYQLVSGSFTQPQAAADATAKRGRLAQFAEKSISTDVAYRMRRLSQGYLWIGLSDAATEGLWQWSDATQPTFDDWLTGQPDGGTNENHAVLMESTTQWADAAAAFTAAGYIFERVGLDPLDADTDADGLPDGVEVLNTFSDPTLDDTDGDGLADGDEVNTHGSSPLEADTDADGLDDKVEVTVHRTNPTKADTDGDGFDDLFEVNSGFDPTKASSTPEAQSRIRTAIEFEFNAAKGVTYRVEGSVDLNSWEVIEASIPGNGGTVSRLYSIKDQPKRYFRAVRN